MRTRRSRSVAVLAAILLTLTLAACGGDDGDEADAGGADAGSEADESAGTGESGDADITIEGNVFSVAGPVGEGDSVAVTNKDSFAHTVTADDGGFDVEVPGSQDVSFDAEQEPGTYPFHCEIHPSMTGELVIE